ncbi:autotransporter domain-containing protein [Nitrosophilus kaiyonis]|uniref:autotransporter domain-containing protein n=1 Tax=Nitrosophilus kaiyonis TaxID=2930200 RepID=UPI002492443E|nr:autotransporter domain-containing protein [Nitrosophilus kaiyonis]
MKKTGLSLIASSLLLITVSSAATQEIVLKENMAEKVYIAKKPVIKCYCPEIAKSKDFMIMLDDNDVTALSSISNNEIIIKPINILNGGEHILSITYYDENGEENQKEYSFKTRQSQNFETANTTLGINPVFEHTIMKPGDLKNVPYSKIDSDFQIQSNLAEKNWTYSFNTDLRYFDQSIPLSKQNENENSQSSQENEEEILKKGFSLATYLFKASYTGDKIKGGLEIGDFSIEESDYSANGLTKRGARGTVSYNNFDFEAFIANSVDYYGFYGGMGLEPNDKKRLYGLSLQKTFLENAKFKIAYIKGGKQKESFGEASETFPSDTSTEEGDKKGSIIALVLSSPIIEEKLNFYAEADFSKYDIDTSDEYGYEKDKAYNVKLDGALNENYSYDFIYEYIGPQFYSIASDDTQNDNEGAAINFNADFEKHSISLSLSGYHDNVEDDDTFATVYTYDGSISYTYSGIENLPIDLSYEREVSKSKDEPTEDDKQNDVTDTYSINLGYSLNNWQFSLGTEISKENDKIAKTITRSKTYSFSPSYQNEKFHLSPNISYNISKTDDESAGESKQKTTTVGLELGYMILENLSFDLSGTYEYTKNEEESDVTGKEEKIDGNFQLAYNFKTKQNWLQNPVVGLKGTYSFFHDKINESQNEDLVLTLFLSLPMQFIF